MKGIVRVLLFITVTALLINTPVLTAETIKIGYVNLQRALNESEAGKNAKKQMEALIASKQKGINDKEKEIDRLKTELDRQKTVLSAEAKKKKEDTLEREMRDYQRLLRDSQEEVQKKEMELTSEIIRELRTVVSKIGKDEGYTMILEQAEGIMLYGSPAVDLTDKVIKIINETKKK